MYAVGKVGSLISRSVYTVSGPFHPFGGAVDIVVVQQQDGSFKSSPWYVRFGKFQGVLKTREKVVNISVNGVEAGFHMYLDSNGEAYFLRDADPNTEEGEFVVSPASSGDEQEAPAQLRKSKSTSCDSSSMEADVGEGKILARTTTARRTTILERMFGRKTVKDNAHAMDRVSSLERAEIAAELLDTKWSTNLSCGSRSRDSDDQPSKSIVADTGNSDQMETSETVLPEHNFDHEKDSNLGSPHGGRSSSANKTDHCVQITSVKEEVVEVCIHDQPSESIVADAGNRDQMGTSETVSSEHCFDHGKEMESNCENADSNYGSPRGGRFRDSDGQPSKSIVADADNSELKEASEIVVTERSCDQGKESNCDNADCNSDKPHGGRSSSANETDHCLQATSVKEEVVEIYTQDTSDFSSTSTTEQTGSEYLSKDLGTDNSIHESVGTLGGLVHNFEDVTGREIHTKEFLSDGVFEIHAVQTEVTNGKGELVSQFVTGDSDGANQNSAETNLSTCSTIDVTTERHDVTEREIHTKGFLSDGIFEIHAVETDITNGNSDLISQFVTGASDGAKQNSADTNLPTYDTIDVSTGRHENSSISSAQDVLEDKMVIISTTETVESYAMSSTLADKVPDAVGISLTDGVPLEDHSIASDGTIEQLISEETTIPEEDKNVVVQGHADSVLEYLPANGPDMENSVGTILDYHITDSAHDLACKNEVVCPDTSSTGVEILSYMPENIPEDLTKDSTVEKEAYSGELDVSVTQPSPMGEGSRECIAQLVNFSNNVEMEGLPSITDLIEAQDTKIEDDANRPISTSGDESGFVQEATSEPKEETEAIVSFSEHIEEIQFQFSDNESFADTKVMDEIRTSHTADEGEYNESDSDPEEQQGHTDSSNDLKKISALMPETSPLCIPGSELPSGDNIIGTKSLPNLRSHIHDLERSDSVQLSCSLRSNAENNGVEPVKDMNFSEQEPEGTAGAEEISKEPEIASNSTPENKHTGDLKVDSFNPVAELSLCRHLLSEGMGEDAARRAFDSEKVSLEKFRTMKQSLTRNNKLVVRIAGRYFPWDAAAPIVLGMICFSEEQVFEPQGMIRVERVQTSLARGGSWWPFSFRRTRAISTIEPVCERILESPLSTPVKEAGRERSIPRPKRMDREVRSLTPTSEELASLDLREGRNVVTFTFSTAMLGKQQVDCRIYLWKWNTRIVISDVDGTITKSDVLGQFMPLVGVDWSQNGVAHLFSAIKENGYQLLFLSARAISQAHLTRQFLFNLKQDGKALPDGPVVISPDGLFPSLYREVIRRAPHEFKISCLEAIRGLFPPDSNPNPFYAGFGNRDTDELSYLKVGIPMGKIFIINPKGEVAVNRRVDTKSYTSLHALVNGMFPPISSSPEQEDYNAWNYWKMPLPDVDI